MNRWRLVGEVNPYWISVISLLLSWCLQACRLLVASGLFLCAMHIDGISLKAVQVHISYIEIQNTTDWGIQQRNTGQKPSKENARCPYADHRNRHVSWRCHGKLSSAQAGIKLSELLPVFQMWMTRRVREEIPRTHHKIRLGTSRSAGIDAFHIVCFWLWNIKMSFASETVYPLPAGRLLHLQLLCCADLSPLLCSHQRRRIPGGWSQRANPYQSRLAYWHSFVMDCSMPLKCSLNI